MLTHDIQEAAALLDTAEDELTVDLSGLSRVSGAEIQQLAALATKAAARNKRIVLAGADVAAYRVLKLVKLDSSFSFRH